MSRAEHVKTEIAKAPARRGRPRDERSRQAMLRAAREMMAQGGLFAVTIEGVAARAGVGRPTVYRHWRNRHEVAMAALMDAAPADLGQGGDAGSVRMRLTAQLDRLIAFFASPLGRSVGLMLAASHEDTDLAKAFRDQFIQARRAESREVLAEAVKTGELREDIDVEVAVDMIYGPVFYRVLMAHEPFTHAFSERLVEQVLRGVAR